MKLKRGFTLIELMIVVGIIAILAAVVIAALNSAKNKGADAAVKAGMKQFSTQAELYYSANGNYYTSPSTFYSGTDCSGITGSIFADPQAKQIAKNIISNAAGSAQFTCSASGNTYSFSVSPLRGGGSWCVDNIGSSKVGTATALGSGGNCQ